jgi:hypothetical protein
MHSAAGENRMVFPGLHRTATNPRTPMERSPFRLFVLAILLLAGLRVEAATSGTVIDVRGQVVFIELGAGPAPRVGDLAELTMDVGGDQVVIGTWRITKLSGPVVEAQAVNAQLPPQKGMKARIGGISAAAPAPVTPPAQPKSATPPPQPKPAAAPAPVTPPGQAEARPAAPPAPAKPQTQAAPTAAVKAAPMVPAEATQAVQFIKTARYERIWDDKKSGSHVDFAVWRPVAQKDFLPLGDVGIAGRLDDDRYPPPTAETWLVRNGVPPVSYRKVWSSEGSGSKRPFSSWLPVPPDGYKCVGDVGSVSLTEPPSLDAVRCVPASCVIETELADEIWEDRGSGALENFSAWRVPKVNTYVGNASHKRPRGVFYTLSDACL